MTELPFERSFAEWCRNEGIAWRTFRYARGAAHGVTQAHRFSPPEAPRGGVLIVHGAGNDALFSLTGVFAELLLRRLEVFSFDVDGHGRASTTLLSHDAATGCIPAALEAWTDRPVGSPLHAVGISLGGSLLLASLPSLSMLLTSAAVVCAPTRVDLSWKSLRREIGTPMLRTIWHGRSRFGLTGLIPSFGPFRREVYPLRLQEQPGPGPFGYVDVLNELLGSLKLAERAAAVRTPVLLVYGGRDLLVPAAQGRELARQITGSELLVLPRDTHLSTPLAPATQKRLLEWIDDHHPVNPSPA